MLTLSLTFKMAERAVLLPQIVIFSVEFGHIERQSHPSDGVAAWKFVRLTLKSRPLVPLCEVFASLGMIYAVI